MTNDEWPGGAAALPEPAEIMGGRIAVWVFDERRFFSPLGNFLNLFRVPRVLDARNSPCISLLLIFSPVLTC